MDSVDVAIRLLDLNKDKRNSIIASSVDEYLRFLYAIASDIYDSCIEDFYFKYTPEVYTRHEDLVGFNLYQANEISYKDLYVNVFIDSTQLLPYGEEDESDEDKKKKKDYVLNTVMKGIRGPKKSKVPGWPKRWRTSYPNQFSRYQGMWKSSKKTLNGILNEFIEKAMEDLDYILWEIISNKI